MFFVDRSLFSAIADVKLDKVRLSDSKSDVSSGDLAGRSTTSRLDKSRATSSMSPHFDQEQPTKIDKRLTAIHVCIMKYVLVYIKAFYVSTLSL